MSKFPVCRICGAMLADESLREKHYDWHKTLVLRVVP
jgi:hypothetical protein